MTQPIGEFNPPTRLMMTPGPCSIDPRVYRALAAPIVGHLDPWFPFADVKRTFYLRHIICHEAHLGSSATLDEIKALCHSCYEFARASRSAIAYYENPNAPLTLDEAFKAAIGRVKDLKNQVKELEDLIVSKIRHHSSGEKAFSEMQEAWRLAVDRQARFDASHHMNGNRGALYEQLTIEDLYRKRLDEIKRYAESY